MNHLNRRAFVRKAGLGAAGTGVLAACGDPDTQDAGESGVVSGPRVSWRLASSPFSPYAAPIKRRLAEATSLPYGASAAPESTPGCRSTPSCPTMAWPISRSVSTP